MEDREVTPKLVWQDYEKGISFNNQLSLYDTVESNENFYIGKQWEGVVSNGLPTPTFNFIRRIVLYLVASTSTDNLKINAAPLACAGTGGEGKGTMRGAEEICGVVNRQFELLFEQNKLGKLVRDFMRNAAVDGDACLYAWFDPEAETGQAAKGGIRTELLENTRVFFGDPNSLDVQAQPYLLISRREQVSAVRRRAEQNGGDAENVKSDGDDAGSRFDAMTDGKCTTALRLWKSRETGTVWACECARDAFVRPPWDTGLKRYSLVWMPWDYVQGCYHGQAAVTGLIPNQVFVNKMFAMTMISLMTTAYPKVVYDQTRIAKWDSRVGAAIAVSGGDMGSVARTVDPAAISPQVSQFIQLSVSLTKEFLGATDTALGNVKPDNTSAIIALQKASSVPMELVRQNLHQCIEDLASIWMDLMRVYYGKRYVQPSPAAGREEKEPREPELFDFSRLGGTPLSMKLDVGGSAYWSEIAQMNTLDNLLTHKQIDVLDYLERVPSGYISNQQELIDTLRKRKKEEEGAGGKKNAPAGKTSAVPDLTGLPGLSAGAGASGAAPGAGPLLQLQQAMNRGAK
jgi:hypothetical protein